ncbi:reverse transcriptase/maturase family protein [Patescibacteria group bacterium]|nr:reverse transcriptase/maturase family protein [Patescibacteria group bacterium]
MKTFNNLYKEIISTENLFRSWNKFKKGKTKKEDVLIFEYELERNIFKLHKGLKNKIYKHGTYKSFYITDPKRRYISKAIVLDRVLHHAVYRKLYPLFDNVFISTSFSCRKGKGTHRGVFWLEKIVRKISRNHTKPCFILKCDIKKFFDSIDHSILIKVLSKRIKDKETIMLLKEIIGSFSSDFSNLFERKGVPIGNLTSQLFANIYMNEFDHFMKQELKVKNYARYTDDFVIVSNERDYLIDILKPIDNFLYKKLKLTLHPNKISIHKAHNGIDYLGYIVLPYYKLLRTKTKDRIYKGIQRRIKEYKGDRISKKKAKQSLQSYLGALSHADAYKISEDLKNSFWFQIND